MSGVSRLRNRLEPAVVGKPCTALGPGPRRNRVPLPSKHENRHLDFGKLAFWTIADCKSGGRDQPARPHRDVVAADDWPQSSRLAQGVERER